MFLFDIVDGGKDRIKMVVEMIKNIFILTEADLKSFFFSCGYFLMIEF